MNIQQKLKSYVLAIIALLTFAAPLAVPMAASAASGGCSNNITSGVGSGATDAAGSTVDCQSTTAGSSSVSGLAKKIVNIFSIIVGAVAIIMLIFGGFKYITSGGESGRVSGAKNTIVYAIIGLIIVALAQLIVHFVLAQSSSVSQ